LWDTACKTTKNSHVFGKWLCSDMGQACEFSTLAANGHDYYLYNQGREGVSPSDNPEMYYFEAALRRGIPGEGCEPDPRITKATPPTTTTSTLASKR